MQTSYIYSVSRVNTLSQFLLTKADIERLLVAEPGEDLQSALKETYLAPYVTRVESGDTAEAIEETLIEAKRMIHRIAPQGDMFRVLWVQYDLHNLRVFAKAQVQKLSYEDCEPFVSKRGIYKPEDLFASAEKGELNFLQTGWQEAFDQATRLVAEGELSKVDKVFDEAYFASALIIAKKGDDAFITTYLRTFIDLYNLKSALRTVKYPQITAGSPFVAGGTLTIDAGLAIDELQKRFGDIGGEDFWRDAIAYYLETGNSTRLDARVDEYLLTLAKQASFDMFSSGSLVLYYLQCRQAAANVRTIVVGKNSGMKEEDIRANLRMAYVNE
jgi:vacuolar-type H+-ATPase subunit C/Vma6